MRRFFLVAEEAIFTRVWVEATDCDARALDAQFEAGLVSQVDGVEDAPDGQDVADVVEPDVRGDQDDAEFWREEHHAMAWRAESRGEEFGVPGVFASTCHVPTAFGDGRGDDGVGAEGVVLGAFGIVDAVLDEGEGGDAALFGGARAERGVPRRDFEAVLVVIEDHDAGHRGLRGGCIVLDTPPVRLDLREIGSVVHGFGTASDEEACGGSQGGVVERFDEHLGSDTQRIAHTHRDGGFWSGLRECA